MTLCRARTPKGRVLLPHGRRGGYRLHQSHHGQLLRWSWPSLPFLNGSGVAWPFRIEVTGGSELLEQLGPITLSLRRGVPYSYLVPEEFGRRRRKAPHASLQVRPNLLVLPKLLEACNQQVDPQSRSP